MNDLTFVFSALFIMSFLDIFWMTKVLMPEQTYNPEHRGARIEGVADWYDRILYSSIYAFIIIPIDYLLYHYGYYNLITAIGNIVTIAILHWCGAEDLGYYILSKFIKFPKEYIETHKFIRIFGLFDIAEYLDWLSKPRKIWFVTIPSIIGFACTKKVPGIRFVLFVIASIVTVLIISNFLKNICL